MKTKLLEKITGRFPGLQQDRSLEWDVITVDKSELHPLAEMLKTDEELGFDFLSDLSGVDYLDYLEVVYHLYSYKHRHGLRVKTRVDRQNPQIDSVTSLWSTADWHEREAYDLYGIVFRGHPNLKRILCADDIGCYPFRKDIPLENNEEWLLQDSKTKDDYGLPEWEW